MSPSPSSLHQAVVMHLGVRLEATAPEPLAVTQAVEIESPGSHLEDRATKPALYARYGISHYWRIEPEPPLVSVHSIGHGDCYQMTGQVRASPSPSRSPPISRSPTRCRAGLAVVRVLPFPNRVRRAPRQVSRPRLNGTGPDRQRRDR